MKERSRQRMATKHGHAAPAYRRRSSPCITMPFRACFCKGIISRTDGFVNNISEKHISHLYEQIGLLNAAHPPLREKKRVTGIKKALPCVCFWSLSARTGEMPVMYTTPYTPQDGYIISQRSFPGNRFASKPPPPTRSAQGISAVYSTSIRPPQPHSP